VSSPAGYHLHDALEHASDTLDDIDNSDEIDDKDGGS
jgi:hypothetical protein